VKLVRDEQGNALLEGVGFAAVAFGLLLTLGMNALNLEREALSLQSIARNAIRYYALNPTKEIVGVVALFQSDSILASEAVQVNLTCSNQDCQKPGNLFWLELRTEELQAKAFGVIVE
jgi:hypothetical protein